MPGGSGAIGSTTVARAAPDGHTLLLASNSHIVLAPLVLTNSPVNVKKDFAPIALMFTFRSCCWSTRSCRCARSRS